ncbi:MAG: exopolysaccharide biosynthesis polyprenyl glycosylphosphotransferase [Thermodesulfobacteriota bacterium]|nr:exopolysaccharide biosynthesis polyprenyl glycosylphosphotransferase [Thermodesulfobacteriota bacterium]
MKIALHSLKKNNKVAILSDHVNFDTNFHNERFFHNDLRLERKRTARSGRPFLLMTIDISCLDGNENKEKIINQLKSRIQGLTRETDIKGWYADHAVIGIIFTEVGGDDTKLVATTISERVKTNLFHIVDANYFDEIGISLQWFPNGKGKFETDHPETNKVFFPDILSNNNHKGLSLFIKRGMDIIGSFLCFILFAPLFIIIPILIKITSKGPVLFKQERLGLLGQKFTFLKFRTMETDCSESSHQEYIENLISDKNDSEVGHNGIFKMQEDARVTKVGHFLRKSSLDELPQFINVLKGEMSLVGPRPPIPYECEHYKIWHMRRIHEVKPGITGLWQVEGRSSTSFNEMVRLDLKYTKEWSLWLDIKILFKTPWAVIKTKGAY